MALVVLSLHFSSGFLDALIAKGLGEDSEPGKGFLCQLAVMAVGAGGVSLQRLAKLYRLFLTSFNRMSAGKPVSPTGFTEAFLKVVFVTVM